MTGYKESDSLQVALSGAIYTMMTDTIKDNTGKIVTAPCHYDFNDPFGQQDWTNRFVNKLLVTHGGNCHSLPFLYKILAEELGIPAYLSMLPEHIYIKQYSKQYNWYNTELTSKSFPVDAWLMTTGCVSTEAIVSGIYMDTLSLKQSIAVCINDLAKGYEKQFGDNDLQFVLNCCELGLKYYPNYTELLLLKAETLKKLYQKETDMAAAQNTYNVMEDAYAQLAALHYREIPDVVYDRWNKSLVNGGKLVLDPKDDSAIAPSNAFASLGVKVQPMLTLSHGEYVEVFEDDTLRRLGSVVFNTVTDKIAYFILSGDKRFGVELKRANETSRFLSIDPIARQYPMLTPYQYASNRPIDGVDLDGLEYVTYTIFVQDGRVKDITIVTDYELKNKYTRGPGVQLNYAYLDKKGNLTKFETEPLRVNSYGLYQGKKNPEVPDIGGDPYKLHEDFSLAPIDEADANAKRHDIDYAKLNISGLSGVMNDQSTPANEAYEHRVDLLVGKFQKGEKDAITGKPISEAEINAATSGETFFKRIAEPLKAIKNVAKSIIKSLGEGATSIKG